MAAVPRTAARSGPFGQRSSAFSASTAITCARVASAASAEKARSGSGEAGFACKGVRARSRIRATISAVIKGTQTFAVRRSLEGVTTLVAGNTCRGELMRTSVVAALVALALSADVAAAQEVTGLDVRQGDGFTTLSWAPVAGATDYQIERTPVGADDVATGPAAIVGVWRPNRTVTPDAPTFADAGFNPGDRFQWRVRARIGTTEEPFSAPVRSTTPFTPSPVAPRPRNARGLPDQRSGELARGR